MARCRFGDVVREIKNSIDRENNPYDYYIAGGHMDSEDLHIHRKGSFKTDDVGPAFIREFKKGQVLYGSRRTYLKKVAVADFDGVTANTTFVLETKDENVLLQSLLPFVMLSDSFTEWSIGKSKGSTNPYVLFSDLADYEFELPPIEKQRTLAKLLWGIDSTKCSYKDLIDKTDEVVKSQFIEMFGDFKTNPKNINITTIDKLFDVGSSKRVFQKEWKSEGVPFYRAREIIKLAEQGYVDNELFISEEMYRQYAEKYGVPQPGDIMVTGVGTLGACYLVKSDDCFYYKDGNTLCFHSLGRIDSRFVVECFKMPFIREQIENNAVGSTVGTYTIEKAKKTRIFNPPMSEQKEFISIVEQSDKSKFASQCTGKNTKEMMICLQKKILLSR